MRLIRWFAVLVVAGSWMPFVVDGQAAQSPAVEHAIAAEVRFFEHWQRVWKASQLAEHGGEGLCRTDRCDMSPRAWGAHCHRDAPATLAPSPERIIPSRAGMLSVCPGWYLTSEPRADERILIDNALSSSARASMRASRDSLIQIIREALAGEPQNDLLSGQLIRLLVDQGDLARAYQDADNCKASQWWCLALRGYVLARSRAVARADSAYAASLKLMPDAERCAWLDVRSVVGGDALTTQQACTARDSSSAIVWWLADPLFIDPVNERRVEHYVRRTLLAFRAGVTRDERYDWTEGRGGDARAEMVVRYGWPSYVYWLGEAHDAEHSEWLERRRTRPNEPYTTYEYTVGRLHTVPNASAIANPFTARASDWALTYRQKLLNVAWPDRSWWPSEHFSPRAPLVQLPEHQAVFLRRDDHVLVAMSAELPTDILSRAPGDAVDSVALVATHAPDSVYVLSRTRGTAGSTVSQQARMTPRATLIGLEFPANGSRPGGRTRFGVIPPQTLAQLGTGQVAISSPIVLALSNGTEVPFAHPDSAVRSMAGSLTLPAGRRIAIYWETYGFSASDSLELAAWIERYTPQGIMRRFTNTLGITQNANTPIVVMWRELGGQRGYVGGDRVPIVGRTVVLDASALESGRYWLDIAARRIGSAQVVRGRTEVVVR